MQDGKIVAAASTVVNPIRQGRLSQLFISRGPVMDAPSPEIFDVLGTGLERLARESNAIGCRIEPGVRVGNGDWAALLRRSGYRPLYPPSQVRSTWILDLRPELEEIMRNMKPKWRYNIRLAEKRGVQVREGGAQDVETFYRLYRETASRDGFYIHPISLYREAFRIYSDLGQFQLLFAYVGDEPIAATTLVRLGNVVWYLYGASSTQHRSSMAPHLLQWEGICRSRAAGASSYDFRGVPDVPAPGQEMYGVYRFKQGFGGYQLTYLEPYAIPYQPALFHLWKAYWRGRFLVDSTVRRAKGHPVRTWA